MGITCLKVDGFGNIQYFEQRDVLIMLFVHYFERVNGYSSIHYFLRVDGHSAVHYLLWMNRQVPQYSKIQHKINFAEFTIIIVIVALRVN